MNYGHVWSHFGPLLTLFMFSNKQVLGIFCGILFSNQFCFIPNLLTDINWNVKWLQSHRAEIWKEKRFLFVFVLSLSEISPVTFCYMKAFVRQWTLLWVTPKSLCLLCRLHSVPASQCTSIVQAGCRHIRESHIKDWHGTKPLGAASHALRLSGKECHINVKVYDEPWACMLFLLTVTVQRNSPEPNNHGTGMSGALIKN